MPKSQAEGIGSAPQDARCLSEPAYGCNCPLRSALSGTSPVPPAYDEALERSAQEHIDNPSGIPSAQTIHKVVSIRRALVETRRQEAEQLGLDLTLCTRPYYATHFE